MEYKTFLNEPFGVFYNKNPTNSQKKELKKVKVSKLFLDPSNDISPLFNEFDPVIYINAGAWEDFRKYAKEYKPNQIGKDYKGWPGEKWLNIADIDVIQTTKFNIDSTVRKYVKEFPKWHPKIDLDNLDLHRQDTGFSITFKQQIYYINELIRHFKSAWKGSVCVRNCEDMVDYIKPDAILVESAVEDDFMDNFDTFHKPIYDIEYYKNSLTAFFGKRMCNTLKKEKDYANWSFIGANKALDKNFFIL